MGTINACLISLHKPRSDMEMYRVMLIVAFHTQYCMQHEVDTDDICDITVVFNTCGVSSDTIPLYFNYMTINLQKLTPGGS